MANPQPKHHTRLSNEILEKLAMIRISGEARQMLDVVLRKTYGWGKKEDRIATSQFMELTGLSRLAIPKARKKLLQMNLITVSKKGYSQILSYSFQKDYDKWVGVSKKVYCIPKGIGVYTKKDTNCIPKGSTQKKERNYTKESICQAKHDLTTPILYLNEKAKRNYDPKNKVNVSLVKARYAEGRSLDDFKKVIDIKVAEWLLDPKMIIYLRPQTLFNGSKFESYINQPESIQKDSYEANVIRR